MVSADEVMQAATTGAEMNMAAGSTMAAVNQDLGQLAERVIPSLVRVEAGRHGAGAGVVVHEQGLVVTNAHVARHRRLKVIDRKGRQLPARRHAWQGRRDLAVLTLEAGDLPALELANSRHLQPGSWVLAMGHPFGVSGGTTAGVVIGVGSRLPEAPRGGEDWLAMSLHLRPGHSGGPAVDASGRLVGLNTRMAGPEVGLAVPSHVISDFLKDSFSSRRIVSMPSRVEASAHWL